MPQWTREYFQFLQTNHLAPDQLVGQLQGYAYRTGPLPMAQQTHDGLLLIGDAAGLASPATGEGIGPAVVSGQLAAETIVAAAQGNFLRRPLGAYATNLPRRLAPPARHRQVWQGSQGLLPSATRQLLKFPWFVRHAVLNRLFLARR